MMTRARILRLTEDFEGHLRRTQRRYVDWLVPGPRWQNETLAEKAYAKLRLYIDLKASEDATSAMEQGVNGTLRGNNADDASLETLLQASRAGEAAFRQAAIQVICDRAVYYVCGEAIAYVKPTVDRKKHCDHAHFRRHYERWGREIEYKSVQSLDTPRAVTLGLWLMKSPWYRMLNVVSFHCPSGPCNCCWSDAPETQQGETSLKADAVKRDALPCFGRSTLPGTKTRLDSHLPNRQASNIMQKSPSLSAFSGYFQKDPA